MAHLNEHHFGIFADDGNVKTYKAIKTLNLLFSVKPFSHHPSSFYHAFVMLISCPCSIDLFR